MIINFNKHTLSLLGRFDHLFSYFFLPICILSPKEGLWYPFERMSISILKPPYVSLAHSVTKCLILIRYR